MNRKLVIGGAVAALLLVCVVLFALNRPDPQALTAQGERVRVERGTISATVNATGSVEANRQVALSFRASGRVEDLLVTEGEPVEAGQPIARLDTTDLTFAVAQAESAVAAQAAQLRQLEDPPGEQELAAAQANLQSAQARLQRLQEGATAEDLRAAEASLTSARANLADLRNGASAEEREAARAQLAAAQATLATLEAGPESSALTAAAAELARAEVAVQQAQAAYDQVKDRPDIGALPQSRDLQQATINYETAKANYDRVAAGPTEAELEQARASVASAQANLNTLSQGADAAQLRAAEAQVAQAEASLAQLQRGSDAGDIRAAEATVAQAQEQLDRLEEGPTEAELAVARANLRQAELSLEQAQENLAGAEIVAPFDGIVATLGAKEGELITSAQPMATVVDLSNFLIEVEVDEADIGLVEMGDPVQIEVDSLPGVELPGEIDYIAPVPTLSQGVVTYPVRVTLDPEAAPGLRVGMSATVDIVTETREGVLLVPTRAIEIDRTTGNLYVERVSNEGTSQVTVTVGLRGDEQSEIVEGVREGETLLIRDAASRRGFGQ